MMPADITITVVGRGFVVSWAAERKFAPNRTELGRIVMLEAAPAVRGSFPVIDETITLEAPRRRAGDV